MDQPENILHELRTGVNAALQRAEERMSHVQRQLAGWGDLPRVSVESNDEVNSGWNKLQQTADSLAGDVDADLAAVQQSLAQFLQQSRELKESL
jgi:uncharacterized protein with NRDE domain